MGDVIDLKAEGARLQKEIKKLSDEVGKIDAKLGNASFMARAPEEVVEEQRERRSQAEQTRTRLATALERSLSETLQAEAVSFGRCTGTDDFAEGITAFLGKRPARYRRG